MRRVMRSSELRRLFALALSTAGGAEEKKEDPPKKEEEEKEEDETDEETEEEDSEKDQSGNVDGLKSALQKERKDRKRLEKEARELRKFKEDLEAKDSTEAEKAKKEADTSKATNVKLATKLKDQAVDMAITKAAQKFKFKDPDDALAQVTRLEDWVEQDEDDPSEIELDDKAIEKAVKELSEKKTYLLQAEGETEVTGSKFGGKKTDSDTMSEEQLREKYSALRPAASSK